MILYTGPSMLDGHPIVVIATAGSGNVKTGPMIQTWILRADLDPVDAKNVGADSSVCGDCPQRHFLGGACYVQPYQAPRSVWYAWWRGSYDDGESERKVRVAIASGAGVRLGSYGDPAAVPLHVWQKLLGKATSHSGYTHQWRNPVAQALRGLCMASCDTEADYTEATAKGWRAFLVLSKDEAAPARSVECLSDAKDKTCSECGICDGARLDRDVQPVSVWIRVHGPFAKRFTGVRSAGLRVAA